MRTRRYMGEKGWVIPAPYADKIRKQIESGDENFTYDLRKALFIRFGIRAVRVAQHFMHGDAVTTVPTFEEANLILDTIICTDTPKWLRRKPKKKNDAQLLLGLNWTCAGAAVLNTLSKTQDSSGN